MPNWNELLEEIREDGSQSPLDRVRRKYLKRLRNHTGRNVIVYYSGWLQKIELAQKMPTRFGLSDNDKNGFMACVHRLDKAKGLDLILHTPGGDLAAVESLIAYLHAVFGSDIRCIVPQLAMSGGTMIALASREILMGKHSSLGPIDPQLGGIPAHGVIEEFQEAIAQVKANPSSAPIWQAIISKYGPAFIGNCQKATLWAKQLAVGYLEKGMFSGEANRTTMAEAVVSVLGSNKNTLSHARHVDPTTAKALGLKITPLEQDQRLQDLVLTVHHACCHTFTGSPAVKIVENHLGIAVIDSVLQVKAA
jgi:hypothetical protein